MKEKLMTIVIPLLGIFLCFYPIFSNLLHGWEQQKAITTYKDAVEKEKDISNVWQDAIEYNEMLARTRQTIVNNLQEEIVRDEKYDNLLNVSGTGIMGTIEIPKIGVDLPIYHGTEDMILDVGAGHLEGTALPVGGENTRCVITGHRGNPNSKLFTRLDELEKKDLFFINVCNQTLAYEVNKIEVIKPEEVEKLMPEEGKESVSLVTCTPYGLNTHRMVVTGNRIPFQETKKHMIHRRIPSLRECCFTVLPFVFLIMMILLRLKRKVRRK